MDMTFRDGDSRIRQGNAPGLFFLINLLFLLFSIHCSDVNF